MTNGELYKQVKQKLSSGTVSVSDWRPASDIYIDDIVKVKDNIPYVPMGIRLWLTNGDSIIYVTKET